MYLILSPLLFLEKKKKSINVCLEKVSVFLDISKTV